MIHTINQPIGVLELRNYILKPNRVDDFHQYFNKHFVAPMTALGGTTLGQFKIAGEPDRFVWMRGFTDMRSRKKFLDDFYIDSPAWKEFGPGANEMMINSDNVHLLQPLLSPRGTRGSNQKQVTNNKEGVIVVDLYICNSTLDKTIELFNEAYVPFLKPLDIHDISLWLSESEENDFPRLPVFQDKNLLVSMTSYKDQIEYQDKEMQINSMPSRLKTLMQELITIRRKWLLLPFSGTAQQTR